MTEMDYPQDNMWRFYRPKYIDWHLRRSLCIPKWTGLFDYFYESVQKGFVKSLIFSTLHLAYLVVSSLCTLWAIRSLMMRQIIEVSDEPAVVQAKVLYLLNTLQLLFGIWTAYTNHWTNRDVLRGIFNDLVKCNRRLVRLINQDVIYPVKHYQDLSRHRLSLFILDVFLAARYNIYLDSVRQRILMVINGLIMISLFSEWNFVQFQLANTYEVLNQYVSRRHATMVEDDYRAVSKICSRVYRIQNKCRHYFKQFAIVSYLGLIRTVALSYISFTLLLFVFNKRLLQAVPFILQKVLIFGAVPAIHILILGITAEYLATEANAFRWNIFLIECKHRKQPPVQKVLDLIILQEHWEDLGWSAIPGVPITRQNAAAMIVEVASWSLVVIMYDAGQLVSRLLTFAGIQEGKMFLTPQDVYFNVFIYFMFFVVAKLLTANTESLKSLLYVAACLIVSFIYVIAEFLNRDFNG